MNTIVIVEDDHYLREELEHALSREGYRAVSVSSFEEPEKEILESGPDLILLDVMLDVDTGRVIWGKQSVTLPETEWRIRKLLMERYPSVVGKQEIVDALWGGGEYVDENIPQVNMARLRKNLDSIGLKHLVKTVRGSGYCLEVTGL